MALRSETLGTVVRPDRRTTQHELRRRLAGQLLSRRRRTRGDAAATSIAGPAFDLSAGSSRGAGRDDFGFFSTAITLGTPLSPETLSSLRRAGVHQAMQGISQADLLRGYEQRIGRVWQGLLDHIADLTADASTKNELVASLGADLVRLTAQLTETITQAYGEIEAPPAAGNDARRRELVRDLLLGGLQAHTLSSRAELLSIPIGDRNVVAIVRSDGASKLRVLFDWVRSRIEAGWGHRSEGKPTVSRFAGEVVLIVPVAPQATERGVAQELHAVLQPDDDTDPPTLVVGTIEDAAAGLAVSYRNVLRALSVATAQTGRVITYPEVLPDVLVGHDPEIAVDIFLRTVEPLRRHDQDHGTHLVDMVQTYIAEGCSLGAAARRLFVHRHTLSMRLRVVERLTGLDLSRPDDLLLLNLGLAAKRVGDHAAGTGTPR